MSKRTSDQSVAVKYCEEKWDSSSDKKAETLPIGLLEMASSLGFIWGTDGVLYMTAVQIRMLCQKKGE